ncbi:MAG: DUF881 domain-containing protein [Eubacteriales bacterium]|nr:DUF881 domain-containing protein [Eubacteriales bacterium]MDD3199058.1 DUF881 domain-containing protein [Eubacteriales bacterium]MDD4629456.1 DUF881 domain-containing protein [Eubacteriales bacterium]
MKLRTLGLFIICFAIGFSIIVQARANNGQRLYVSAKTITDYQTTIDSERKETERIDKLTEEAGIKLKEYQALSSGEDNILKDKLQKEREQYKVLSGNADVQGEGVVIIIDDGTRQLYEGEDPNTVLVHDMDILNVINELNRSGAEVLAVNGQRIVNDSSISCSGYTIRINGQFFARPFEIKAIGDSKRMAAALIGPEGYGTLLSDYGVIFKLTIKEDVTIRKFMEYQAYEYMTKVKEEE